MPAPPTDSDRDGISASRTSSLTASGRVLIGGVGYHNLRDLSFGPFLAASLEVEDWPAGVEIEDLSYGPIGVMHNLDARPPYDRLILVAGVKRGRPAGSVTEYRFDGRLPDLEEIQARVAEAGSGVVSLDNLLVVLTWFGRLPRDVAVVEVEAVDEGWGEGFTPEVERAIPEVTAAVRKLSGEPIPDPARAGRPRTLVAGFGSLLLGDDGFGIRVLERLSSSALPPDVELLEVGTGGIDLVLALKNGFSRLIVVDAVAQGRAPGAICAFTPQVPGAQPGDYPVDPHFAEPSRALRIAAGLGVLPADITVLGCEPDSCELGMELTPAVQAAVERAAETIREMISRGNGNAR